MVSNSLINVSVVLFIGLEVFSLFSRFAIIILLSICNLYNSNRAQIIAVRII